MYTLYTMYSLYTLYTLLLGFNKVLVLFNENKETSSWELAAEANKKAEEDEMEKVETEKVETIGKLNLWNWNSRSYRSIARCLLERNSQWHCWYWSNWRSFKIRRHCWERSEGWIVFIYESFRDRRTLQSTKCSTTASSTTSIIIVKRYKSFPRLLHDTVRWSWYDGFRLSRSFSFRLRLVCIWNMHI